jgi:hypothetical protein
MPVLIRTWSGLRAYWAQAFIHISPTLEGQDDNFWKGIAFEPRIKGKSRWQSGLFLRANLILEMETQSEQPDTMNQSCR